MNFLSMRTACVVVAWGLIVLAFTLVSVPLASAGSTCDVGGSHRHVHIAWGHARDTHEFVSAEMDAGVWFVDYWNSTHSTGLAAKIC